MSFYGNTDFLIEVAKGNVPGHSLKLMQGANPNVDISNPENLWDLEDLFVYPVIGEQWEIVSDSVDDTLLGTGAQKVTLAYLDDNYDAQEEEVELNGTTPVLFTATNQFRPELLKVSSIGSGQSNDGILTVRVAGGGDGRIGVIAGGNRSLHGFYTVPTGKQAFLISGFSTIQKGKDADISVFATVGDDGIFFKQVPISIYQNSIAYDFSAPIGPLPEHSEVKFLCETENNNTGVQASVQFLEVEV